MKTFQFSLYSNLESLREAYDLNGAESTIQNTQIQAKEFTMEKPFLRYFAKSSKSGGAGMGKAVLLKSVRVKELQKKPIILLSRTLMDKQITMRTCRHE